MPKKRKTLFPVPVLTALIGLSAGMGLGGWITFQTGSPHTALISMGVSAGLLFLLILSLPYGHFGNEQGKTPERHLEISPEHKPEYRLSTESEKAAQNPNAPQESAEKEKTRN